MYLEAQALVGYAVESRQHQNTLWRSDYNSLSARSFPTGINILPEGQWRSTTPGNVRKKKEDNGEEEQEGGEHWIYLEPTAGIVKSLVFIHIIYCL